MSLVKLYNIQCNGCYRLHGNGRTTYDDGQTARARARRDGWKRTPGSASMGKDWCPDCAPEGSR